MKNNLKGFGRSFTAVVVLLCMLFSILAPTVLAASDDHAAAEKPGIAAGSLAIKDKDNYVSLGDSVSGGYGLENVKNSYTYQFAEQIGAKKHTPLSVNGMRAEDLLFVLNLKYSETSVKNFFNNANGKSWSEVENNFEAFFGAGDKYTYEEMVNGAFAGKNMVEVAEKYQTAVTEADVITLAIGNADFGNFLFNKLISLVNMLNTGENDVASYNPQEIIDRCEGAKLKAAFQTVYGQVEKYFGTVVSALEASGFSSADIENVKNLLLYSAMSYVESYTGVVKRIVELNPDVDVVFVANINVYEGFALENGGAALGISLGDIAKAVITPINAFMAALPTYLQVNEPEVYSQAGFFYAETSGIGFVIDDIAEAGDLGSLREPFLKDIVGENGEGIVWSLAAPEIAKVNSDFELIPVTLTDVENYEALLADTDALAAEIEKAVKAQNDDGDNSGINWILSCAVYLGLEKAIVASANVSAVDIQSIRELLADVGGAFSPVVDAVMGASAEAELINNVIAAVAKPLIEEKLNEKVQGYFDGKYEIEDITIEIDGTDIEKILADKKAAAELAESIIDSVVNSLVGYYPTLLVSELFDKLGEAFTEVNTTLSEDGYMSSTLSVDGYKAAVGIVAGDSDDVILDKIYADIQDDYINLKAYINEAVTPTTKITDEIDEKLGDAFNKINDKLAEDGYMSSTLTVDGYKSLLNIDEDVDSVEVIVGKFYADTQNDYAVLKAYINDNVKPTGKLKDEIFQKLGDAFTKMNDSLDANYIDAAFSVDEYKALLGINAGDSVEVVIAKLHADTKNGYGVLKAYINDNVTPADGLISEIDTKLNEAFGKINESLSNKYLVAELTAAGYKTAIGIQAGDTNAEILDKIGADVKADYAGLKAYINETFNVPGIAISPAEEAFSNQEFKDGLVNMQDSFKEFDDPAGKAFANVTFKDGLDKLEESLDKLTDPVAEAFANQEFKDGLDTFEDSLGKLTDPATEAFENQEFLDGLETMEDYIAKRDNPDELKNTIMDEIEKAVGQEPVAYIADQIVANIDEDQVKALGQLLGAPDAIGGAVKDSKALATVLHIFARNMLADGVGAHPNQYGHDEIAKSVVAAYENRYTTIEKLVDSAITLVLNIYANGTTYAQSAAAAAGLIASATGAIDNAEAAIISTIDELESGVSATSATNAVDARRAAIASLKNALNHVKELKAIILSYNIEDVEKFSDDVKAWYLAIEENLTEAYVHLKAFGKAAAIEAYGIALKAFRDLKAEVNETVAFIRENTYRYVIENLGSVMNDLSDAVITIVRQYAPEAADYIREVFAVNPDRVIAFIKEYAPVIANRVNTTSVGVVAVVAYVAYRFGGDTIKQMLRDPNFALETVSALVDNYGHLVTNFVALYGEVTGYTAKLENFKLNIMTKLDEEIAKLETTLTNLHTELIDRINGKKDKLEALLNANPTTDAALAEIKALRDEIAALENDLVAQTGVIFEEIVRLRKAIDDTSDKLETIVSEAVAIEEAFVDFAVAFANRNYDKVDVVVDKLQAAIERFANFADKKLSAVVSELEKNAPAVGEAANIIFVKLDALEATANRYAELAGDKAQGYISNSSVYAEKIKNYAAEIAEKVPAKVRQLVDKFESTYGVAIETLMDVYEASTSANYVVKDKSFYVALGDVALADSKSSNYADRLAGYLGINYKDLSKNDITTIDMIEVVKANADYIKKADIVTIGYSNAAIIKYASQAFTAGDEEFVEWKNLFGTDIENAVNKVMAKVETAIENKLGSSARIEKLISVLEAYAYAYVSQIVALPEVVDAVREISPYALIAVVGAYNEFGDVTLTEDEINDLLKNNYNIDREIEIGSDIELGKYFGYVTKALNVESLIYTMHCENTIYVDAYEVSNAFVNTEGESASNIIKAVMGDTSAIIPDTDGQRYIFAQIAEAIGLFSDCDHMYDNDCDDTCNLCGHKRQVGPHQYTNNAPCDPDCNICGAINENAVPHKYGDPVIIRKPTLNFPGEKIRTCTVCLEASIRETIPIIIPTEPEDDSNLGLILAIVIPSVIALGVGTFAVVWFGVKKKSWADLKVATVKVTGNCISAIKKVFTKGK